MGPAETEVVVIRVIIAVLDRLERRMVFEVVTSRMVVVQPYKCLRLVRRELVETSYKEFC
jgi:hypothetical protein